MSTVGADSKVGPPSPLAPVPPFVDAGDADPNVELHGLMVLRHGYVVAEGAGGPRTRQSGRGCSVRSAMWRGTPLDGGRLKRLNRPR